MADSFELLRARVVIDVAGVKAASISVAKLQGQLTALSKPIKINVQQPKGPKASATKGPDAIAKAITGITAAAIKAELSTKSLERKLKQLTGLRSTLQGLGAQPNLTDSQRKSILQAERQIKAAQERIKNRSLANSRIQLQADQQAARASTKAVKDALKAQEQARLQSIQRVIRAAQKAQIVARDPKTNDAERTRLLARAEELLVRVRQRVAATSREAIQIEQRLAQVRKSSESGTGRLTQQLKALANVAAGISQAPGINSFVRQIGVMGSRLLFGAAQLTKMTVSAAALTAGIAGLIIGGALAASVIIDLSKAAAQATLALGRAALTLSVKVLTVALTGILSPLRLAVRELSRLFTIAGAKQFVQSMLEVASTLGQARAQLQLALGAAATQEFQRLRVEADQFGVAITELASAYGRFSLAMQGTSLQLQDIRNLFTGVQAAARANALSMESLTRIFRAFEQIGTKGQLRSEELVQQLGDALPGATRLAAKSLGFTVNQTQDLIDAMRRGEIQADKFLKAFGRQLIIEFFDKAISLSDSLAVRLVRLQNAATIAREGIGDFFGKTVIFGLERIVQAAIKVRAAFAPLGAFFTRLARSFQKSFGGFSLEAVFEGIARALTRASGQVERFLDRLATLGIVFNGAVLVAAFGALPGLLRTAGDLLDAIIDKLQRITGIDFSSAERAAAAFAAALDVLPLIGAAATRIWIHFKTVMNQLFDDTIFNIRNLVRIYAAVELFKNPAKALGIALLLKQVDEIVEAFRNPLNRNDTLTGTIGKEMDRILELIAQAQKNLKAAVDPPGGKPAAAAAIDAAADNLRNAMSGEAADILDPIEWVRRLNAATFNAKIASPEVAQQAQDSSNIQETAKNTRELVTIMRNDRQQTPLFAR